MLISLREKPVTFLKKDKQPCFFSLMRPCRLHEIILNVTEFSLDIYPVLLYLTLKHIKHYERDMEESQVMIMIRNLLTLWIKALCSKRQLSALQCISYQKATTQANMSKLNSPKSFQNTFLKMCPFILFFLWSELSLKPSLCFTYLCCGLTKFKLLPYACCNFPWPKFRW